MYKRCENQLLNEKNTLNSDQRGDFWKLIYKIRLKNWGDWRQFSYSARRWDKAFSKPFIRRIRNSRATHSCQYPKQSWQNYSLRWNFKWAKWSNFLTQKWKSSWYDTFQSEMIKGGKYYFIPSLERIFNDIIKTGTFPTEWNMGVIKPIDKKKGDKKCSVRGIALTGCLGKLFYCLHHFFKTD